MHSAGAAALAWLLVALQVRAFAAPAASVAAASVTPRGATSS
jgi:hypothetical protein